MKNYHCENWNFSPKDTVPNILHLFYNVLFIKLSPISRENVFFGIKLFFTGTGFLSNSKGDVKLLSPYFLMLETLTIFPISFLGSIDEALEYFLSWQLIGEARGLTLISL